MREVYPPNYEGGTSRVFKLAQLLYFHYTQGPEAKGSGLNSPKLFPFKSTTGLYNLLSINVTIRINLLFGIISKHSCIYN